MQFHSCQCCHEWIFSKWTGFEQPMHKQLSKLPSGPSKSTDTRVHCRGYHHNWRQAFPPTLTLDQLIFTYNYTCIKDEYVFDHLQVSSLDHHLLTQRIDHPSSAHHKLNTGWIFPREWQHHRIVQLAFSVLCKYSLALILGMTTN